jgi:hypothetical protein
VNRTPRPDPDQDGDLAQRFSAERAHDERSVPGFARVLERGRVRTRHPMLQPAMALGAAAIVLVAGGIWRHATTDPIGTAFVVVPGQLRLPTDFLLDIASNSMRAGEMPSIGAIDWYPLREASAAPITTRRRN